jgi:hypothetical protein
MSFALFLAFQTPSLRAQSADAPTQPRDITGIEEPPPAPAGPRWPYFLGFALAAIAVAGAAAWRFGRGGPRPVRLPPDQWALQELDAIAAKRLPEAGQGERFHTLISDVIRRYVDLRYDLRAPKQTTPEFLKSLAEDSSLPPEKQAKLSEFLRRCDIAKFAPVVASVEESREVLELARAIVQEESVVSSP